VKEQTTAELERAIVAQLEELLLLLADDGALPPDHCNAITRGRTTLGLSLYDSSTSLLRTSFCAAQLEIKFPFLHRRRDEVTAVLRDWTSWLLRQHAVYHSDRALTVWT
jgi:hypothetical protein